MLPQTLNETPDPFLLAMWILLVLWRRFRYEMTPHEVLQYSSLIVVGQELFRDCGEINAITIPVDKHTGRAKGFAYLEFADKVVTCSVLFLTIQFFSILPYPHIFLAGIDPPRIGKE
jgi:hypothetical protein